MCKPEQLGLPTKYLRNRFVCQCVHKGLAMKDRPRDYMWICTCTYRPTYERGIKNMYVPKPVHMHLMYDRARKHMCEPARIHLPGSFRKNCLCVPAHTHLTMTHPGSICLWIRTYRHMKELGNTCVWTCTHRPTYDRKYMAVTLHI